MFSDGPRLYQPHITRLPSLLSLLTITLALIAVIEIACRRLPARESDYIDPPINLKRSRDLNVRDLVRDALPKPENDVPSSSVVVSSPDGSASLISDGKVVPTQPFVQPSSATIPVLTSDIPTPNSLPNVPTSPATTTAAAIPSNNHDIVMPIIFSKPIPWDHIDKFTPALDSTPTTAPGAAEPSDYPSVTPSTTPPIIYSTANPPNYLPVEASSSASHSDYLPVQPTSTAISSNYLDVTSSTTPSSISYSSPNPPDYLPVETSSTASHSDYLPDQPTSTAISSNYLDVTPSITPPIIYSSASPSDYLPVQETSSVKTVNPSEFLPVDPVVRSTTTEAVMPSNYLSVTSSITPPIIYSTANPSDYLPVSNDLSVNDNSVSRPYPTVSDFLPVSPVVHSTTTGAVMPSNYLGVSPSITPPIIYSTANPSDYLPVEPAGSPSASEYLPVENNPSTRPLRIPSEYVPYVLTKSLFLPVGPDSQSQSAFLPVPSHEKQPQPGSTSYDAAHQTAFLPVSQKPNGAPSEPTLLPIPPANLRAGITGSRGPVIQPPKTGIFQGESYSMGTDGAIFIGGKSFMANSPTTATLANGKVIIMGPGGASFQDAPDVTLPVGIGKSGNVPTAGVFHGESYLMEPSGVLVIGGKTFAAASPTTATLANGKVIIMGPEGASFQDAPDVTLPVGIGKSANVPTTGVFQGESYVIEPNGVLIIGGKTFATASPATATLADGRIIIVGPSGASFQDAPGLTLPVGIPNSANSPARTGKIHGEPYSMGSNGVVVVGGKTFTAASPTTATLADGKIVIVGPSGILVQEGHSSGIAESVTMPPQTGMFKGEPYTIGPDGAIFIGGKSFATASPTTATLADGKIVVVGPSGVSVQDALNNTASPKTWVTPYEYVVGGILPTVIAVIFSIPWHLLALAVKEIQPFYQLQHPDGATAQDSIGLDYRYSINAIATFTAMRKGHYLVWWTGLISMAILFVAPLATGTIFIGFTGLCTATSGRQNCFPKLSVYPVGARILQGILGFIAILTFFLAIAMLRKRSGVYANPLSIAALATLFQNQQVIEDFRRLNPYYTDTKMIRAALRENRYRIGPYVDHEGAKCYGLTKCHDDHALMDPNYQTSFRKGQKYSSVSVTSVEDHQRPKKRISLASLFIHPAAIITFAIFVAGLEVLIIYYNRTGGDTGFERWMDSQSFGVGFLFTAVGVILKMYWSILDEETRNMEPYRQLLTNGAKAGDSILLAPHSNPYTGIFYSLRNQHYFNAYLSLVAIFCEPLIVALADIPFRAGSVFTAYRASTYICIGVLSMMLIGIVWMLCRKRTPELIRKPDTVASVLLFLCGSSMLEDFKGMSRMRRKTRDAAVRCWDKSYAMGSVIGVDGVEREGIDESLFVTGQTKED